MKMTRTRLHLAICAVSVLAAAPAFAQGNHADPQEDSAVQNPGMSARTPDMKASREHMKPGGSHAARSASTDRNGDSAVDKLNEQSLQAARAGQAFDSSPSGNMPMHDSSSGTMGTPGGSMGNDAPPAQTQLK
jgi:hypothetical protein